jgi:hypothetical protein
MRLRASSMLLLVPLDRSLSALWQRESLFYEQGLLRVRGVIAEG